MKPYYHYILLCLLGILLQVPAFAQQNKEWRGGPLQWSDLQGKPADYDFYVLNVAFGLEPRIEEVRKGLTTYTLMRYVPVIDTTSSWCPPSSRTPHRLRFLQTAFDMLEIEGRKATNAYMYPQSCLFEENFSELYLDEFYRKYDDLIKGTLQGKDSTMTQIWNDLVEHELQNTHIDPTLIESELNSEDQLGIYIGAAAHLPYSNYVSSMGGLAMGFQFNEGRHNCMIDFALCFGKAKRDIKTHLGWIYEDESLINPQLYINYGYRFKKTPSYAFYAFAGAGIIGYEPLDLEVDEDEELPSKAGFSLDAGFCLDLTLHRQLDLTQTAAYATEIRHCLRLRPFVSLTGFHGAMGWTPSLGISLSYFLSTQTL